MADRMKLIERIAARGRRKLEKLAAKRAAQIERAARPAFVENAKAMAKREALFAEMDALNARRAERTARREAKEARRIERAARVLTPQEIATQEARRTKREEQKAYRAVLARERLANLPAPLGKRADAVHAKVRGAAERAAAVLSRAAAIKRHASRLPPLPYSNSPPPLPY